MDRSIAERIASDLADGKRVMIVGRTLQESNAAFREALSDGADTVRWAYNEPRANYPNGAVLDARSATSRGYRGMSIDTVVLLSPDSISPDAYASIVPLIATSASGEIVAA